MDNAVLALVLAVAVFTDLRSRVIPNSLNYMAMTSGLILNCYNSPDACLAQAVSGCLVGILSGIIPFMLGGLGGGDVKLLAAIGALKGVAFLLVAEFFAALVGAIAALAYTGVFLMQSRPWVVDESTKQTPLASVWFSVLRFWRTTYMPYAPAIATGVLIVWIFG